LGQRSIPALEGQREGEVLHLSARRHVIFLLRPLILPALGCLLLLWLAMALGAGEEGWLLTGLGILMLLLWSSLAWVDWTSERYWLTSQRVVALRRLHRVFEERREVPLARVQAITLRRASLLATLFDYGDLRIQTASVAGPLEVIGVRSPERWKEALFAAQGADARGTRRPLESLLEAALQKGAGPYPDPFDSAQGRPLPEREREVTGHEDA